MGTLITFLSGMGFKLRLVALRAPTTASTACDHKSRHVITTKMVVYDHNCNFAPKGYVSATTPVGSWPY